MRNIFLLSVVFLSMIALTAPSVAQTRDSNTPREPTTKAGKCAKANGGNWVPNRGWYTRDSIAYKKCMGS
ncbi:MAG: hypothetical protein ACREEK_26705 [Bradyrhizobium sp.]